MTELIRMTVRLTPDNYAKLLALKVEIYKTTGERQALNTIINDAIRAYQLPNDGQRFIE